MTAPIGPYESERQALAEPAVRAVYEAYRAGTRPGDFTANRQMLGRALDAAGVAMGRYDDRIAEWVSQYEPQMVAVIAGWIARAHRPELEHARAALPAPAATLDEDQAAAVMAALADAEQCLAARALAWCDGCQLAPDGWCDEHAADRERADAYFALRRQLGAVADERCCPDCDGNPHHLASEHQDPHPEGPACRDGETAPALDSEAWACRGCGGQMIGQRTPDDLCAACLGFRLAGGR